jgi:predicted RNase H-like HicB family nuclease
MLMRQVILYTDEDGMWIAEVPSLMGCGSQGKTREEALENVREAIELWLEDAAGLSPHTNTYCKNYDPMKGQSWRNQLP